MRLPSASPIALEPSSVTPRARIEKAAQGLEAQFAQMLIKSMRSASFGDPLMGENSTYREMYDQQLSRELTKGRGLGLAPLIVRQLERSGNSPAPATVSPTAMPLRLPGAPAAPLPLDSAPAGALPLGAEGFGWKGGALPLAAASRGVSMSAFGLPTLANVPPTLASTTEECPPEAPLDCSSPEAFVHSIWPQAQKAAAELGVPAKALVAQAALETGWGRRLVGHEGVTSHNLFGIKATGRWQGQRMSASTHEFVDGVRRSERAEFRAYGSTSDSFADYARLLGSPRYAGARGAGDNTERFANALQRAGYATDPAYGAKISAIANGATLRRALATLPGHASSTSIASTATPSSVATAATTVTAAAIKG